MKIIYPNNISFVYAHDVADGYSQDDLIDGHTKSICKFNTDGATVYVNIDGAAGLITVHNTNADQIIATAYEGHKGHGVSLESGWSFESGWSSNSQASIQISTSTDSLTGDSLDYYYDFANQTNDSFVKLAFSVSSGDELYIGEICAGPEYSYRDPYYGITEAARDYGILQPLPAGGRIYQKRNVQRTFGIDLFEDRTTDTFEILHTIALNLGGGATGFVIADKNTSRYEWSVYAYFVQMPSATHSYPDNSIISFDLEESV